MEKKVGRNDPCPCGSGKKYKQCCLLKQQSKGKKKFAAKVISTNQPQQQQAQVGQQVDLMERTFGSALDRIRKGETPPPEQQT